MWDSKQKAINWKGIKLKKNNGFKWKSTFFYSKSFSQKLKIMLDVPSFPRNNSFANFKLSTGFDTEIIEDDIETFKR